MSKIFYYQEIDSTNNKAKELAAQGAPHRSLVVADRQTAGRGRRGRVWLSEETDNVYMTILLRPEFAPDKAPMLTLVMAYSAAQAIHSLTGLDIQIKWPNDLVWAGRKLVGILTEMSVDAGGIHYVIVGVGVNVNTEYFPKEVADTAVSLRLATGKMWDKSELITDIEKHFEENYKLFERTEDLTGIQDAYNDLLVNRGREVCIHGEKESYRALARGINSCGELIVCHEDGREEAVYAGEVSVRGIYGYI
ncbi:MAG: biotin--[acetyl-CoA-carboxylase] ligase [Schaedlerella sp.]|nr:biotin--[acetyl-CoA-carboxylase] ligase [Schaedlerella sp.]